IIELRPSFEVARGELGIVELVKGELPKGKVGCLHSRGSRAVDELRVERLRLSHILGHTAAIGVEFCKAEGAVGSNVPGSAVAVLVSAGMAVRADAPIALAIIAKETSPAAIQIRAEITREMRVDTAFASPRPRNCRPSAGNRVSIFNCACKARLLFFTSFAAS